MRSAAQALALAFTALGHQPHPPGCSWPAILLRQVHTSEHPDAGRLPRIEGAPEELQQLVWDCTAYNRKKRPTAGEVVQRLEALLELL